MAVPNIGQGAATTFERVTHRTPTDNVFTSWALLNLIKSGKGFKKEPGGSLIEETVLYAENTSFRSYGELDILDTTRIDQIDAFRYDWKQPACGTIVFSELEKEKASGDSAKIDLVAVKVKAGKDSAFAILNRMLYGDGTGNGGLDCNGLGNIVSSTPTVGTLGGVNRATWPFARNRQVAGTKTTTAFDNLRGAMRSMYNSTSKGAKAEHPTDFIFDQTSFEGYESTLVPNERFMDKAKGDGGFRALAFKGAEVSFDEDCPAGTGYVLNDRNLFFRYLVWMKAFPAVDPANQFAEIIKVLTIGQLTTDNPRRLGVITSIT